MVEIAKLHVLVLAAANVFDFRLRRVDAVDVKDAREDIRYGLCAQSVSFSPGKTKPFLRARDLSRR
jgi:hypothetical protein